jgi:hypothetical protein
MVRDEIDHRGKRRGNRFPIVFLTVVDDLVSHRDRRNFLLRRHDQH